MRLKEKYPKLQGALLNFKFNTHHLESIYNHLLVTVDEGKEICSICFLCIFKFDFMKKPKGSKFTTEKLWMKNRLEIGRDSGSRNN